MAIEQYKNGFTTTLNGAITDVATSLTLTAATGAPTAPFRLQIESELILVGARSGTACSALTRGAEGTIPAAHADTTPVTHVLTRGSLLAVASVINQSGAVASAPAAVQEGNLYWPTDGAAVLRDTGAALEPWGPITKFTDPTLAGLATWVNQGTSTVASANGMVTLIGGATGAGSNLVAYVKTAPSTPYTITTRLRGVFVNRAFQGYGLCFRDSASGKLHVFDYLTAVSGNNSAAGARILRSVKYTTATVYSADYLTTGIGWAPAPDWVRLADDGTNRILSVSPDGLNWLVLHTIGRTDFLTANQVGLVMSTENSATPNVAPIVNLLSWKET